MKRRLLWSISVFLLFISIPYSGTPGAKNLAMPRSLNKTAIQDWKFFDGNSIQCTISSSGPYCDYLRTNSSGLLWPKGSGKNAVYSAGIWMIGVHRPTGALRTAVQNYETEFQPGKILTTFNTTTNSNTAADDPTSPIYHVYKISKSDTVGGVNPDYDQWPASLGAPVDEQGKPYFWGDQQLWCVYNDADTALHNLAGRTSPMGIEVQATYFGFDQGGSLGNTMFVRWKIINKSDADYDSVFISLWSDTDLGGANDDYAGVDVGRKLEYVYNADNNDAVYGVNPPADGFILLQGPRIKNPDSTASFEGKRIKGFFNNEPTAHAVYMGGDPLYHDPPLRDTSFAPTAYGYQNGMIGATNQPYIDPTTGNPSKFVCDGDPVTGTGWLMSALRPGGKDVRSLISSGPFTLAKGDTQEIVGAFVIAQGNDRLNSVTHLRRTAEAAWAAFDNNFHVPMARANSTVWNGSRFLNISVDGTQLNATNVTALLLNLSAEQVAQAVLFDDGQHDDGAAGDKVFGTSIFHFSQRDGLIMDLLVTDGASRTTLWPHMVQHITTSSLPIGGATIVSDNLNDDGKANPGENVRFTITISNPNPFGFGKVSVLSSDEFEQKTISFDSIPAYGNSSLVYDQNNSSSYFSFSVPAGFAGSSFAVYFQLSDSTGNVWEDSVSFPVIPFQIKRAVIEHVSGSAEGEFSIVITDATAIRNHLYSIRGVDSVGSLGAAGFTLKDSTDGRILFQNQPLTDDLGHLLKPVDGFKLFQGSIQAALFGQSWTFTPSDEIRWFGTDYYVAGQFSSGYQSTVYRGDFHKVQLKFEAKNSYTDVNGNGKYDIGEPYQFDTLNTQRAQKAFFYGKRPTFIQFAGYYWVPFAVFDLDTDPVRQLTVVVLDNDQNNQWDINLNSVLIFSDSYDPAGELYDPIKGGRDLSSSLSLKMPLPIYWYLGLYQRSGNFEPYSSAGELTLTPSYPLTAKDLFLFNPTIVTKVENYSGPVSYSLEQNYPNPFNPSTTIRYSLEGKTKVRLRIYNVLGQLVSTLVDEEEIAGTHAALWNGMNSFGAHVSTGIYFYRIEAGNFIQTKKMILLK